MGTVGEPNASYENIPGGVPGNELQQSAVSWSAVLAGSSVAIALTLILTALGAGIGLSLISPWRPAGMTAGAVGVSAIIWLVTVQWIASGAGGFVTGRLRTKWRRIHTHEVFFRDTAHGLLTWSVAAIVGGTLATFVVLYGAEPSTEHRAGAATAAFSPAAATMGATSSGPEEVAYLIDMLFRSSNSADLPKPDVRAEVGRIFLKARTEGGANLPPADRSYILSRIMTDAGIDDARAEQRLDEVVGMWNADLSKAQQEMESAHKNAVRLSIVLSLSMFIGAFIASAAAALGGTIRDEY